MSSEYCSQTSKANNSSVSLPILPPEKRHHHPKTRPGTLPGRADDAA